MSMARNITELEFHFDFSAAEGFVELLDIFELFEVNEVKYRKGSNDDTSY